MLCKGLRSWQGGWGITHRHTPVFIFKHIQKNFFSLSKKEIRTYNESSCLWSHIGLVLFNYVLGVPVQELAGAAGASVRSSRFPPVPATGHSAWAALMAPLGKHGEERERDSSAACRGDHGGADTPTAAQKKCCALKEMPSVEEPHWGRCLSCGTAAHGEEPHGAGGKREEEEAAEIKYYGLTPNPHVPTAPWGGDRRGRNGGEKLSLGNGRGGQKCCFNSSLFLAI